MDLWILFTQKKRKKKKNPPPPPQKKPWLVGTLTAFILFLFIGLVFFIWQTFIKYFPLNADYYTKRMAGFFLYVSDKNTTEGSHLCYHHDFSVSGKPPLSQTIHCSVRGRYVIYYNERLAGVKYPRYFSNYAYNELCEIEVYGKS